MEYMTAKQAAEKWGITANRITILCKGGRIPGVRQIGTQWMIPEGAEKPADGRTRQVKTGPKDAIFRFPLYVNFEEKDFVPPLSKEEAALRRAQKDFFACEFERAKGVFETLSECADDIYVKICSLVFMCALSISYDRTIPWELYYHRLNVLLEKDFPYKKEIGLFLPWLDFLMGRANNAGKRLISISEYQYHQSAWYMSAWLSAFNVCVHETDNVLDYVEPYEVFWHLMERDGHFFEAQELHMLLFITYYLKYKQKPMLFHLQKILGIAYEHNLLFAAADMETYYAETVDSILVEYPVAFTEKIKQYSHIIFTNFSAFADNNETSSLYAKLTKDDYALVFCAVEGFTNKQAADKLKLSERTVVNRYNAIYDKLGVAGKPGLVSLFQTAMGEKQE